MLPNLHRLGAVASDIVLFNFGVWHNGEASVAGNASLLESYITSNRGQLPFLVWRETAPQHFATPLGEFSCSGCPEAEAPYECKVTFLSSLRTLSTMNLGYCTVNGLCEASPANQPHD